MFMLANTWSCFLAKPMVRSVIIVVPECKPQITLFWMCLCFWCHSIYFLQVKTRTQRWPPLMLCAALLFSTCVQMRFSQGWGKWTLLWLKTASCQIIQVGWIFCRINSDIQPVWDAPLCLPSQACVINHQRRTEWARESRVWWEKCQTRCSAQPAVARSVTARNRWAHNYVL